MSIIFLRESAVHYEALGRGRPVVFLHTWVGSWQYWIASMQAASISHSAYALDLYGYGDTSRDHAEYSLDQQAALLGGFLDEMGIDRIALIGHGLGALTALTFAAGQPSRVARLMAIALPLDPTAVDGRLHSASPEELIAFLGGRSASSVDTLATAAAMDHRAVEVPLDANRIHASLAALREADVPCLLVYGAQDPLLSPPALEQTMAFGPNVHQVVVGDSGHFPMLDAADAFHRLLIDFLALEPGTSPRGLQPKEEWRRRVR